ncbi:hypothetical protein H4Q26_009477 [Puccinia striiformis f. sp. tritici PST-130]|nr:hypothetical protein H4Q26_009477 [Puccinia striiformis f. sp. tritici PST-130]
MSVSLRALPNAWPNAYAIMTITLFDRQKAKSDINQHKEDFPDLPQTTLQTDTEIPPSESDPDHSFARRQLASNADRYLEPEPDPNLVFIEDPNYQLQLEELDNERKKADATRAVINSILVVRRYLLLAMIRYPLKQPVLSNELVLLDISILRLIFALTLNSWDHVCIVDDQDFLDEVLNDSSGTYGKSKRT